MFTHIAVVRDLVALQYKEHQEVLTQYRAIQCFVFSCGLMT